MPVSLLTVALVAGCATSEPIPYPMRDASGRSITPDPDSCFASEAARRYVHEVRNKVLEVWQPPPNVPPGAWKVAFDLRIDAHGGLNHAYPLHESNPLNDSALAALNRAAPFGEVPPEALCLTEQPFAATFSVRVP